MPHTHTRIYLSIYIYIYKSAMSLDPVMVSRPRFCFEIHYRHRGNGHGAHRQPSLGSSSGADGREPRWLAASAGTRGQPGSHQAQRAVDVKMERTGLQVGNPMSQSYYFGCFEFEPCSVTWVLLSFPHHSCGFYPEMGQRSN